MKDNRENNLVGDPFAPESEWLAEFSLTPEGDSPDALYSQHASSKNVGSGNAVATPSSFWRLPAAVIMSGGGAYFILLAAHLGFDWGYKLVDSLFGQTAKADQAITASLALAFIVMPIGFGLLLGFFKSAWSGKRLWYATNIVFTLGYSVFACFPNGL